ncbi:cytochrome c [Marinospirillum sp.]|uniref:c-type cytochrome n=1 Tax=Marinospirillum sp. TaxID=2183934 RepID=UPI0028708199|nr:cytochrome c [Marinospirillum sp.]MDR9468236.1 cytochrome c [Marinospirillum sp.]
MLKKLAMVAAAGFLVASPVQAHSNPFNAEDAVEYRQALYQVISAQAGVMGAMVKGDMDFDGEEINKRAKTISQVAGLLSETYFPATRDVDASNMKDVAWEEMESFQEKGKEFGQALQELVQASSSADFDRNQAKSTVGALGKSCKSCHDDYRNK